jgi:hypothetical protein
VFSRLIGACSAAPITGFGNRKSQSQSATTGRRPVVGSAYIQTGYNAQAPFFKCNIKQFSQPGQVLYRSRHALQRKFRADGRESPLRRAGCTTPSILAVHHLTGRCDLV